jgi:hypothetical protein
VRPSAPHEQQSKRFNAAGIRRRLRVTWERLRPFGISRPHPRFDHDSRYPIRQAGEALAAPALRPIEPETVAAWVVRAPDGAISSRAFDEADAQRWAGSRIDISPPDSGLYVVEEVRATLRPTGVKGGASR